MAIHKRQAIREAVKAQLIGVGPNGYDYRTAAALRVYATRVLPWKRGELPAIAVYMLEESVAPESKATAPRELTRNAQLAIEAAVKAGDNVDDALDAIALEIERAIHSDETLAGTASDAVLATTELNVAEDGERLVGFVRLTYSVTYYTYAPEAADVVLDDLTTVNIRTSLGGTVAPADQAEDLLENLHLQP